MAGSELVKLVVGESPSGHRYWLGCQRGTAEHFGWDAAFSPYGPLVRTTESGLRCSYRNFTDRRVMRGGVSVRIARVVPSASGPRVRLNRFRVSSGWRLRDFAALAAATTADWQWLETASGVRRSRAEWLAIHQTLQAAQ